MPRLEQFDLRDEEQAEKMQKNDADFGVKQENADNAANPELDKQKMEQEQQKEKESMQKTEEKMQEMRSQISNMEQPQKTSETQKAEEMMDVDMWPPIFDDTSAYMQSQVGGTEGGTSLDTSLEN